MKIEKTDSLAYLLNLDETWAKHLKPTDVLVVYALQGRLAELEDQVEQVKAMIKLKMLVKAEKCEAMDSDDDDPFVSEEGHLASRWKDEPKRTSGYNMDKKVADEVRLPKTSARLRKMVSAEESMHD
jgi:hypothetical protein